MHESEAAELLSASAALRNELAGALDPSDCEEVARLEELLTVQAEPRERAPSLGAGWGGDRRPRRARAPPLGSVTPTGWLEEVVQRSANGLPGHLFEFYPPVVDSNFVGGRSSYSSLLEDFPYALNGLVPLAAASKSPRLAQQCTDAVRRVLETGGPPGWLGPDEWPEGVMDHPEENFPADELALCLFMVSLAFVASTGALDLTQAQFAEWRAPEPLACGALSAVEEFLVELAKRLESERSCEIGGLECGPMV
eukprot:g16337.t1